MEIRTRAPVVVFELVTNPEIFESWLWLLERPKSSLLIWELSQICILLLSSLLIYGFILIRFLLLEAHSRRGGDDGARKEDLMVLMRRRRRRRRLVNQIVELLFFCRRKWRTGGDLNSVSTDSRLILLLTITLSHFRVQRLNSRSRKQILFLIFKQPCKMWVVESKCTIDIHVCALHISGGINTNMRAYT